MANIFPDSNTGQWTYSNTTRVADDAFTFHSVGAYVKVTVTGEEAGLSGGNLYIRGVVSHPQSLRCRIDFYVPPVVSANPMEIEKHFVYLHADDNGVINQEVVITSGRYGYFDHIDIQLEATLDVGENIELTSFVIDDPSLSELLKVAEEIEENLTENMSEELASLNEYANALSGLYTTEITQPGGAKVIYAHDHPYIEQSDFIAIQTAGAYAWTNTGWNGGSPVWQYGVDQTGNAIFRLISTVGLNADWVKTGRVESVDGSTYFDLNSAEIAGVSSSEVTQIIDASFLEEGGLNEFTGAETVSDKIGRTRFIAIEENTPMSVTGTVFTFMMLFYRADKSFIETRLVSPTTTPAGTAFVRLRLNNAGIDYSDWKDSVNGTITGTMPVTFRVNASDGFSLTSSEEEIMKVKDKFLQLRGLIVGRDNQNGTRPILIFEDNYDGSENPKIYMHSDTDDGFNRFGITVKDTKTPIPTAFVMNSNPGKGMYLLSNRVVVSSPEIELGGMVSVSGTVSGGSREATSVGGANANSLINEWSYVSSAGTNLPTANNYIIHTIFTTGNHGAQIAYGVALPRVYSRAYNANTSSWSAWARLDA